MTSAKLILIFWLFLSMNSNAQLYRISHSGALFFEKKDKFEEYLQLKKELAELKILKNTQNAAISNQEKSGFDTDHSLKQSIIEDIETRNASTAKEGFLFRITESHDGYYYVTFDGGKKNLNYIQTRTQGSQGRFVEAGKSYYVERAAIEPLQIQEQFHTELGILTIPFKLRFPRPNNPNIAFSPSGNLNISVGLESRLSGSASVMVGPFAGFALVPVSFVDLSLLSNSTNSLVVEKTTNKFGGSTGFFMLFKISDKWNAGVVSGIDIIGDHTWDYEGIPWLSLAIGFNFFSKK